MFELYFSPSHLGTALVYFIVDKSGKIADAKVLTEVHSSLKSEALRLINSMPDFIPGKKAGKVVDVACTIPFKFLLQSDNQKSQANLPTLKGDFGEVVATALGTVKEK